MIIQDPKLLKKYIPDSLIIEQVILSEFGLTGGNLIMDGTKVKVIITEANGMNIVCQMFIPFETVVQSINNFSLMTFNIEGVDYIAMSCSVVNVPDDLSNLIKQTIENKD